MEERKPKVLLVDDDQFLLNMYGLKFTNSGFEVVTADSGEAGLKKLKEGLNPDIVLADIVMPLMDGLQFVQQAISEHLVPASRCIMLTNQGQSTDIDRAKELGVGGYIVKASTVPSEVVEEVKAILAKTTK
ncbi:MAG: response regulator [bacterium]|nr:response regulator [bacterium]